MKIKLKINDEFRIDDLLIKVIEITIKRALVDLETGLGDDVLRVTLRMKRGDKENDIDLFKEYVNDKPVTSFEGYEITMIYGDEKSVELDINK